MKQVFDSFFPFVADLRAYTRRAAKADLAAGLTAAAISIPQAMAYALVAGVHPKYGLYASIVPVIAVALWGSSRYLQAGPTNAVSMLLFSACAQVSVAGVVLAALPEDARMPYIFGVAVLAGVIQIVMGLARLGELSGYVSHAVMTAFMSATALLIAGGQIKSLIGLDFIAPGGFFPHMLEVWRHASSMHVASLAFGLGTIVFTAGIKRFFPRLPAALITLILSALAAALINAEGLGVRMVGAMEAGLPPLSLPPPPDLELIRELFLPALAIALVGALSSIAIGKSMAEARNQDFDACRELIAQGLGNVSAGFFSGLPGCGSFVRSAVSFSAGARTRFAAVFSGILTLAALLLFAPLTAYIPIPSLAGLLIVIAWGMIDVEALRFCLKATRTDGLVLLTTLGAGLLLDLEKAILLGVLLSLLLFIRKSSQVRLKRAEPADADASLVEAFPWAKNCPQVALFFMEGTLFFGAIHELEQQLRAYENTLPKVLILHLNRVFWLDASGAHSLLQFMDRCLAKDVVPILIHDNASVRAILERSGVFAHMGEGFLARNLYEALDFAGNILARHACRQGACRVDENNPCFCLSNFCLLPEAKPAS